MPFTFTVTRDNTIEAVNPLTVVNNTTITAASQWLSLPITMPTIGYRYLRYLCTSPGSSQGVVEVVLGEWEFYGEVSQV